MQVVLFTKLFRGRSLKEIGAAAHELGFDGIDLLIRPGYQLEPSEPDRIPSAVRLLESAGLAVPMATTDLTDLAASPTERLFGMCAQAGVQLIRLGYWQYEPERGYASLFDSARRHLEALEELARKMGVRVAIQLHGGTIHSSGSLTAALLQGHDPACVGAYADPGNQAVQDGREGWQLTFDLLRPWLCCIGVKNGGWFPAGTVPSGQRQWRSDWLSLAEGMVPWDEIIAHLVRSRYEGLLSFHSHYEVPLPQALDQTWVDLQFIRRHLLGQGAAPSSIP
jgi:sugar phosphate isomerase/epimerase